MNQIKLPKKVFVLGAGASKASDFELPTMDEFFDKALLSDEFRQLKEFLCKYSGNDDPTTVNLEDVMSYLEISSSEFSFLGASSEEKNMINYIKSIPSFLKRYIIKRLSHGHGGICKKHKELFDVLQPEDTVITLNYDIIADYALEESERKPRTIPNTRLDKLNYLVQDETFSGGPPTSVGGLHDSPGYYLKLHGSINWVHCPNLRCRKHDYIAFHQPGLPCAHCGSSLEVLIIPPTFTKKIETIPKLQLLWNLARREIFNATEIVLIGVSLAPSDFLLRWLLKHATTPIKEKGQSAKVIVVNPSCEHLKYQEHVKKVMATDIYPFNTIEEYLNSSNKVLK